MFVPEHPIKHLKTFRDVRWNFVECSRIQKVLKVFCETFQNVELEQVTMFFDKLSKNISECSGENVPLELLNLFHWRKMFKLLNTFGMLLNTNVGRTLLMSLRNHEVKPA